MLLARKPALAAPSESAIGRRLGDLREVAKILKRSRLGPLETCRAVIDGRALDLKTRSFFAGLPEEDKHYWISSLYALLMPEGRRRRLAAYFTPPHLATHAIEILTRAGIEAGTHRILDPASGGAAFLVPLACQISKEDKIRRLPAEAVLQRIENSLFGVEIEPGLAALSRILIADLLKTEIRSAKRKPRLSIQERNTLNLEPPKELFDAIIGNPPYGRVLRPTKKMLQDFAPAITNGYVNLYALFLEQALRFVKPGGVICLIVPMSFIGGPYFANLRKRILQTTDVLSLDPIDKRSDVFLDVLYDVCVLALRKKSVASDAALPTCSLLMIDQPNRYLGNLELPKVPNADVWALPDVKQRCNVFLSGLETLSDYGYVARTGYFVWNREQKRYRVGRKPRSNEVPLFWAHNVRPGMPCRPYDGDPECEEIGFVKIRRESAAIIRQDAIILQRTSNRRQNRRLLAAVARQSKVPGGRGFVSENHTIVIARDPQKKTKVTLSVLCRLLNTSDVDSRFRRISGSVSVSTKALNQLPLPAANQVHARFVAGCDDELAAQLCYAESLKTKSTSPGEHAGE
jgi:adenine-specific DNA-methyltransferase